MTGSREPMRPPPTVVVVDDEMLVRDLFRTWLENAGYHVLVAPNAQTAQELLTDRPVDVLVSDIRMAQQTGIDLLAWVRERDPDLPVILVTGYPAVESAVEALRLQAYDYLVKPVAEETLLHTVRRAVEYHRLQQERRQLEEENRRYQEHLETLVQERTAALEHRTRQLLLLHRVAREIGHLEDEPTFFQRVVQITQETFNYMTVSIYTPDATETQLELQALHTRATHALPQPGSYVQPVTEGLLGLAFRERRPVIANDVTQWPEFKAIPDLPIRSEAVIPIILENRVVALLNVNEQRAHAFDETDEIVLNTLADYIRITLANIRLYQQVREALKAREEMLNNVSHELRTPLTIIRGYAELLLEQEGLLDPDEVRTMARTILDQTRLLAHQVEQLVAIRRIQREELVFEHIPYTDWLYHAVTPWRQVLAEAGLRLELEIPEDLGYIRGHPEHLTRVIHNLLDNARKFSPGGGTVRVKAWREGRWVYTAIADEGIGIPPDKLPRIFEPFYQVEGGTTRRFGGMGLGLALVHEIITRHGGEVWAESPGVGKGVTVTFRLPAAPPPSTSKRPPSLNGDQLMD